MTRIHGYVRFSYMGRSDARLSKQDQSAEDLARTLYAPQRMATRFRLFEQICLPSLRAQTHPDFRIVILASPAMPEGYRHRLEALVATLPQGQVVYSEAESVVEALNPHVDEVTARARGLTFHFRLDDDDALCRTAIAAMDRYCDIAVPDELLSFPRGFLLVQHEGEIRLLRKYEDFIAIGLGFFAAPGTLRYPYSGSHRKIHRLVPTRMEPRLHAYVHVAHPASDTMAATADKLRRAKREDPHHATAEKQIARLLERNFPFKVKHLVRTMAGLQLASVPSAPAPAETGVLSLIEQARDDA